MTAQPGRYTPLFISETVVPRPWIGCGIVTDIHVTARATLGESQTKPNGRPYKQADLKDQLEVGLRAFTRVADSNGIPDRDDAQRIHRAMFPGLPDLIPLLSRDFDEVVEALRPGEWAVSIALYLPAMPAGLAVTRYTRAPHQVGLHEVVNGTTNVLDGMHPPSLTWAGHRVPLSQIERAAKAFPDSRGLVMAWKAPVAGWTQEALAVEAAKDRIATLRAEKSALETQVANKVETIADLRAQLANAGNVDCSGAVAAEHERTLVAAIEKLEAMRGE